MRERVKERERVRERERERERERVRERERERVRERERERDRVVGGETVPESHSTDLCVQILVAVVVDGDVINQHRALSCLVEVLEEVDAGTLSTSTGPHEGHHLPRIHGERHIL